MNKLALIFLSLTACILLQAQDTLPRFSVKDVGGNRFVISWTNKFETIKQISIQRSFDSLKNFKTILTVPDATTPQNGYVDTKAPNDHMFYRLYILLEKGVYLFSDPKKPVWDSTGKRNLASIPEPDQSEAVIPYNTTTVPGQVTATNKIKTEQWVPSPFVYTFKDGYIRISLPEADKKYSIKFFTVEDKLLFELKDIKERNFKVDKANFYSAGWFKFELYEDGAIKEKNKFFLPKEF